MTNIKLVNHSSVLIQEGNNFILTDPWFEKPAFGSWFPVPPTSVHPVYLVALAKSDANFAIAISHGHDDHLDDDFLSLFPMSTPIIIPQYIAKGLKSRLTRLGFENIIEASTKGISHNCFKIKSYINMSISRDDAILTFETPNNFIVHANDNWQKLVGDNLETMKKDASKFKSNEMLYMSQCNLADGFPNIYKNYSEDEKSQIHDLRVKNMISTGMSNADELGAKYFLNYAGYAAAFVKGNEQIRIRGSFKDNDFIDSVRIENNHNVEVLQMIPGDDFNFKTVIKQFGEISLNANDVKDESFKFYEKYDKIYNCDTYKSYDVLPDEQILHTLENFLSRFASFVEPRLEKTNFNTDIMGCKVVFSCSDGNLKKEVVVGGEQRFNGKTAEFSTTKSILSEILRGSINWENLYIGYGAQVKTTPKDINIRAIVRWLAMYGYVYQRETNEW
jgi:hypothetical protein